MKKAIFIDGLLLHFSAMNKNFSYTKFKTLLKDLGIDTIYYFNCIKGKEDFLKKLLELGFILRIRKPISRKTDHVKTVYGVDTDIIMTVMEKINDYEDFYILSGKLDMIPLIEKLEEHNKKVTIVGFESSINAGFFNYKTLLLDNYFTSITPP